MRTIEERLADYASDLERASATAATRPAKGRGRTMTLIAVAAVTIAAIAFVVQRTADSPASDRPAITPEPSPSGVPYVPSSVAIAVGEPTTYEQWYNAIVERETPTSLAERFGVTVDALAITNGWADGADHVLTIGDTVHIPADALAVAEAMVSYVAEGDYGVGVSNDGHTICLLYRTEISGCDSREQGAVFTVLNGDGATTMVLYGVTTAPNPGLQASPGTPIPALKVSERINGLLAFISTDLPLDFQGTFIALDGEETVATMPWPPVAPLGASGCTYTVQSGDSPKRVAAMFGVTLQEMGAANLNTPGYRNFVVGIIINIPNCVPPTPSAANTAGG